MRSHRVRTGMLISFIMCGIAYNPTLAYTPPENSDNIAIKSDVSSSIPIHNTYPKNSFVEETSDSHVNDTRVEKISSRPAQTSIADKSLPEKPTVQTGGSAKPRHTWPLFLFAGIISLVGVIATIFTGIRKN